MKKKLLCVFLSLLTTSTLWAADGDTFTANTVEGVEMTFEVISESEKTCQVGGWSISSDTEGSITIPCEVNGYQVKEIGSNAFSWCYGLTSVTIPESVTNIGSNAFWGCIKLAVISFPNNIDNIGGGAFDRTAWYDNLPDGVVYLGKIAYNYKGTMPDNTVITLKEGTKVISERAFSGCTGLISITIPESVTSIGDDAFEGCSGLTSITVESGNSVYDSRNNCNAIIETTTNKLIAGCKNTIVPNGITCIGDYAFDDCSGLTSITIPEGVTNIGNSAFGGCSGLTNITMSENVKNIGDYAFYGCRGLTSITIPESVTSIGDYAFYGCRGLTSITIPEGVTDIKPYTFFGCRGLTSITFPGSLTNIGDHAFSNCSGLTSITIPEGMTSIGDNAFEYCQNLTSITISNSVTSIGDFAFTKCGLTSITIPQNVTSIGSFAFDCSNLNKVVVLNENPEPMNISSYAFAANREMLYVPQGTKERYTSLWGDQFEKIIELADADVTLGKNVVSFASEQMLDFSTPIDDLKAYIVSGISSDGKAIINEVTGAVPSGTGLILKGTAGHSYTIPYTTTVPAAVSNMLVGVTEDTEIGGNDLDYILSDGKFVKASYGTLPAGKAYLKLDEALARSVITIGDEITGIKAVDGATIPAERYYNLNGQRVSTPQKGLYIVNGKKVAKK